MGRRKAKRGGGDDSDDEGDRATQPSALACVVARPDPNDGGAIAVIVPAGEVGKYRLDQYITDHLPGLIGGMRTSKSAVQRSIKSGLATVNGVAVTKASASVRAGDRISYREFKPEPQTCAPEPIELDIKYEDGDLIVVNKPAGMTVHPAKGLVSGTLVNALLHHVGAKAITLHADEDEDGAADGDADESDDEGAHQLSQMRIIQDTLPRGSASSGVIRPGIVHRIDRETSGLLVVAKSDPIHAALSVQFAQHTSKRTYIALCWGCPSPPAGTVSTHLARDPLDRKRMSVCAPPKGKAAVTHYKVILATPHASAVELTLHTGRTHQIRVHMKHIGHALLGDKVYLPDRPRHARPDNAAVRAEFEDVLSTLERHALHAGHLGFVHPAREKFVEWLEPIPPDMLRVVTALAKLADKQAPCAPSEVARTLMRGRDLPADCSGAAAVVRREPIRDDSESEVPLV